MPKIDFRPETDGFAFKNSWELEPHEMAVFPDLMIEIFENADSNLQFLFEGVVRGTGAAAAVGGRFAGMAVGTLVGSGVSVAGGAAAGAAAGGFVGAAVGAFVTAFGLVTAATPKTLAKKVLEILLPGVPTVGLCGGMAAAALDYHRAGLIMPRGSSNPRTLGSNNEDEIWLRKYIFERLHDSLILNGATFLEIQALYNFGDIAQDVDIMMHLYTSTACDKIMSEIDSGNPCAIGLVSTSINPSDSHQIICYGYDKVQDDVIDLLVHDNNYPDRECTIRVQFGERGIIISHYDAFLKMNEDENELFIIKSPPSYCAIIHLNYKPQVPRTATYLSENLKAIPQKVLLGNSVAIECKIKNRGFGSAPKAVIRALEASRYSDNGIELVELAEEADVSFTLVDTPPSVGAKSYRLDYRQKVTKPSKSIVPILKEIGLDAYLRIILPGNLTTSLSIINGYLRNSGHQPKDRTEVQRKKRLTLIDGSAAVLTVQVFNYNLQLICDDIGSRCDPTAFPGKSIKVQVGPESFFPDSLVTHWHWKITFDGSPVPFDAFKAVNECSFNLPEKVGAIVAVQLSVQYSDQPKPLVGEISFTVNDEAGNRFAKELCETMKDFSRWGKTIKIAPKIRDKGWVIVDSSGRSVVDKMASEVRAEALKTSTKLRLNQLSIDRGRSGPI